MTGIATGVSDVADRREFIGTYECMGGTTYAADYRWAILGEAEEIVRCRDCKRGSDIGTGDLVHCNRGSSSPPSAAFREPCRQQSG